MAGPKDVPVWLPTSPAVAASSWGAYRQMRLIGSVTFKVSYTDAHVANAIVAGPADHCSF